jgi:soluble lytic murein transglycosylase
MQLMPQTADDTIFRANLTNVTRDDLTKSDSNIQVGSAYLSLLKQTFRLKLSTLDETSQLAMLAVAYNAGPGKTKQWINQNKWDGTEAQLHQVPFGETRHYVHRVLYYYQKYKGLYNLTAN